MLPFLVWIPVATSLVLGLVFLFTGDGRPALKTLGIAVFVAAIYLQFFSRYALYGMLLQIALALVLAVWRRGEVAPRGQF